MVFNTYFFIFLKFNLLFYKLLNNKFKINLFFFFNFSYQFKHNWFFIENDLIKYFQSNLNFFHNLEFTQFFYIKYDYKFLKNNYFYNLLSFKKQNIFFKKTNNYKIFILNFIDTSKINLEGLNSFKTCTTYKNIKNLQFLTQITPKNYYKNSLIFKNYNFRYKTLKYVYDNRNILMFFLNVKIRQKNKKNKIINTFIKKNFLSFYYNFEFNAINTILKSSLFFNKLSILFFIKNGFFFLNGFKKKNLNFILKSGDFFQFSLTKYYFFFYKHILNSFFLKNKINFIFWKKTNNIKNIPSKLFNIFYFKNDVPNFIEVDFLVLSFKILYKPNFLLENDISLKLINFYQKRLYNWKSII